MCVWVSAVTGVLCVWASLAPPRWAPPLAGSRGRPGLRAPCGRAERTHGVGIRPALGPRGRCGAGWLEDWLVVGRARFGSLARSAGRSGPEGFVGLTGLTAPALLGWGLRVIVCAWSVSVWVGPR